MSIRWRRHLFSYEACCPKNKSKYCGKTADQMVSGMFLQTVLRDTSAHVGHAIHVAKAMINHIQKKRNELGI
jgi:hypothetical protein